MPIPGTQRVYIGSRLRFKHHGEEGEGTVIQIGGRKLENGCYVPGWALVEIDSGAHVPVDQLDMLEIVGDGAS